MALIFKTDGANMGAVAAKGFVKCVQAFVNPLHGANKD
jgi:hypothetical protein